MITFAIIGIVAAVLFMLLKDEQNRKTINSRGRQEKVTVWLLIGLLATMALFSPKVRERIQNLRKKVKL